MSRIVLAAVIVVTASSSALAVPVYLDCQMPSKKGSAEMVPWTIALNEEAGTVTWSHSLGTNTGKAQFTPDHIIFSDGGLTIDRTSLQLTRQLIFRGEKIGDADYGQCKVSVRKRTI
jgi:hypothetical protein